MAVAMIDPKFYAWDRNGKPLAFGKVFTYQARTNTPKPTYQSEDGLVENTNPVILNGEGYADIYLDGSYKIVVKDSDDNEIWTADPVTAAQATEWVNCLPATYLSPTSFKVNGNFTAVYELGRRVRIDNGTTEFAYSTIQASSFAGGETTIVVSESVISTGISSVCSSVIGRESIPELYIYNFDSIESAKKALSLRVGDTISLKERHLGFGGGAVWDVVDTAGVTPDGFGIVLLDNGFSAVIRKEPVMLAKSFGVKADGLTDDLLPLKAALIYAEQNAIKMKLAYSGETIALSELISIPISDTSLVNVDFSGATIVPLSSYHPGVSDKLFSIGEGDNYYPNAEVTIENSNVDCSVIAPVNNTDGNNRKGLGGLQVRGAGTVNIVNSKAKGMFYSAAIYISKYNRLLIDGLLAEDVGVKFNALSDNTGVYDAAGDCIYTNNPQPDSSGNAKVTVRNASMKSYDGLIGRAGFVSEFGADITGEVSITFDNVSFDGYQRTTHQEDGGVSKINWVGGSAKNFSVCNFALADSIGINLDSVDIEVDIPFQYGNNSGVMEVFNGDQNKIFGLYKRCNVSYKTTCQEQRSAKFEDCEIVVSGGVTVNKVGSNDIYSGGSIIFNDTSAKIAYQTASEVRFTDGIRVASALLSTSAIKHVTGGRIIADNKSVFENALPNVDNGSGLSSYNDVDILVTDPAASGNIMLGTNHLRKFENCRIAAPDDNNVTLYGDGVVTNKFIDGCDFKNVILQYSNDFGYEKRATTNGLRHRFTSGSGVTSPIKAFSLHVVHVGYILDREVDTVSAPSSAGNHRFIASVVVNADGSVTNIT